MRNEQSKIQKNVEFDALMSQLHAAIAEKDEWKRGAEAAYAAHDATMAQLQEAEERWNSHSCTQKLQGLELVQARAERDALRQKVAGYEAALEAFRSHVAMEATPIQNGKPMSEPEVLKLTWLGEEARQVRQALEQPTQEGTE